MCLSRELAREKMWSRIHLIPLLQAEEDRDLVRRHLADQAREKELLGENFKVYNSDRYGFFLSLFSYIYSTVGCHDYGGIALQRTGRALEDLGAGITRDVARKQR